jgi:hypothetical protein
VLFTVLIGLATTTALGRPASAAGGDGDVVVFSNETLPLTVWHEPHGCIKLPTLAHTLTNQLDRPVRIYADPLCATPNLTIQPGYGSHVVPGSGSFSA